MNTYMAIMIGNKKESAHDTLASATLRPYKEAE
jgi:hypothetical protein